MVSFLNKYFNRTLSVTAAGVHSVSLYVRYICPLPKKHWHSSLVSLRNKIWNYLKQNSNSKQNRTNFPNFISHETLVKTPRVVFGTREDMRKIIVTLFLQQNVS